MLALNILDNINNNNLLIGKSPTTLSGLSLFLAFKLYENDSYNKEKFYFSFCNKNTLKKAYGEIKNDLYLIIPQNFGDKLNLLLDKNLFKFL